MPGHQAPEVKLRWSVLIQFMLNLNLILKKFLNPQGSLQVSYCFPIYFLQLVALDRQLVLVKVKCFIFAFGLSVCYFTVVF